MQSALARMNAAFQEALWNDRRQFVRHSWKAPSGSSKGYWRGKTANITLPGEADSVRAVTSSWQRLLAEYPLLFLKTLPDSSRRELYRDQFQPLVVRMHDLTQHISDMNLSNMVAVDGQAQLQAAEAKRITYALVVAGMLLALILIYVTGRSILQPLGILTRSIREVQQGNLNLVLNPQHRDEVGQLMEAFNDMAAQLRVLKQGEQAKLARSQQSAQLVLDNLPDAVVVMAPDATVELVNDAARKILGVHPGSSIYETSAAWVNSVALDGPKDAGNGRRFRAESAAGRSWTAKSTSFCRGWFRFAAKAAFR